MIKNFKKRNLLIALSIVAAAVIALSVTYVIGRQGGRVSEEISVESAEALLADTFNELPATIADGAIWTAEESSFKVKDIKFGGSKDAILTVSYSVPDVASVVSAHKQELIDEAYLIGQQLKADGKSTSATQIQIKLLKPLNALLEEAKITEGETTVTLYEVSRGKYSVYLDDESVDALTGGMLTVAKEIDTLNTANYNGEEVDIKNDATLRTGLKQYFQLDNYESKKPDTGNWLTKLVDSFIYEFNRNFIEGGKWMYLVSGLGMTLAITLCAGLMGIVLGFIVAIVRCTNELTGKLGFIDKICRVYLTVIRGTPVMVQLLIIYFVIFLPIGVPKFISAFLCFGLNSGAYVAEIVRGGIMSVDKGQTEAGRSLGFGYWATMVNFVMPQAFKAVLPSLANEFITLLKESSVAFYIGISDLTQGGLRIRSITYSSFMPLVAVALIYLAIVMILTKLVGMLERRLRKSDH